MSSLSHRLSLKKSSSKSADSPKSSKGVKRTVVAVVAITLIVAAVVYFNDYKATQRVEEAKSSYESGMNAYQTGNASDAVLRLKKSVELDPKNDKAHLNLARSYVSTGKLNDAKKSYVESLKLNPNQSEAEYNLAIIYKSEGEMDDALAHFEKAKKLDKNLYAADIMLATIYRETGKPDKAIPLLAGIVKAKPFGANMADIYVELGLTYQAKGDINSAKLQWQQALNIDKQNARAKSLLGIK